jgi:hypothetical protein
MSNEEHISRGHLPPESWDDMFEEHENLDVCWEETLTSRKTKKRTNSRKKRKSEIGNIATTMNASKVTKRGRKPKKQREPKPQKYAGPSNTDVGSLLTGDLIQDARTNRDLPGLPAMTDTRKDKALTKLISSLPPEVHEIAKVDKKAFDRATKDFRKGNIWIAEEGSRLSGLNCTLRPHQVLGMASLEARA